MSKGIFFASLVVAAVSFLDCVDTAPASGPGFFISGDCERCFLFLRRIHRRDGNARTCRQRCVLLEKRFLRDGWECGECPSSDELRTQTPSEMPSPIPGSMPAFTPSDSPLDAPTVNKLRIFVLTGQSNMQGHGCENNLKYLVSTESEKFGHLWNGTKWSVRDDVSIHHYSEDVLRKSYAPLVASGDGFEKFTFGPEVGTGWTLGEALEEDILLLKIAWGGKSLAVDFRPPKSCEDAGYSNCGINFAKVASQVHDVLDNIESVVPNFERIYDGYELSGLVFHQGFNDVIDQAKVDEYEDNLSAFIDDMRIALNSPNLPIVVGELGMHGDLTTQTAGWKDRVQTVRDAQANAVDNTFNARLAQTAIYVEYKDYPCTTPVLDGDDGCPCDGYHYYNDASAHYYAGVSMGNALLELMAAQYMQL